MREQKERLQRWLNCRVTTQAPWPKDEKSVKYGKRTFFLRPLTKKYSASIHLKASGISDVEAMTAVNRFLSALAWKSDQPTISHYGLFGIVAGPMSRNEEVPLGYNPTDVFPNEILEITDEKAKLAVALYREGLSLLDSVPFRFLSFFKVLNVFWKDKTDRKSKINPLREGIRRELQNINDSKSKRRIATITKEYVDAAAYLYEDCRCAVAHAYARPIVDPDNVEDLQRLSADLPLIQDLVAYLIEKAFGLKQSIWQ